MIRFAALLLFRQSSGMRIMTEHKLPVRTRRRRFGHSIVAIYAVFSGLLISHTAGAEQPCPPDLTDPDGGTVVSPGPSCPGSPAQSSQTPDYNDPVAGVTLLGGRTVVNAGNAGALTTALGAAACGDTIQLSAGTYGTDSTLNKTCPANNPIILKGAANFGSVFTATLTLGGARNIVTGIDFNGSGAGINLGGTNNKVIANKFRGWGATNVNTRYAISVPAGGFGEIAYNDLSNPGPYQNPPNNSLRIAIRTTEGANEANLHKNAWVHHNYFHDFPTKPVVGNYGSGQDDAMEICQTGQRSWIPASIAGWYIESNLISNHQGADGLIDLKCGGMVVRYNTIVNSNGRLDLRAGGFSVLESNWIRGTGAGIQVHGKGHSIIGNNTSGAIKILAGTVGCTEYSTNGSYHAAACDIFVAGNNASLVVGDHALATQTVPTTNAVIEQHTGNVVINSPTLAIGTVDHRNQSTAVDFVPAVQLTIGQVGPAALASGSAAYKAARGF